MYPRPSTVSIRLSAPQAETIFWELLGLLDHYRTNATNMEPSEESALLSAISQLELGIKRAETLADTQLEQLRAIAKDVKERV
jgi:hypothetical protein